MSNIPPIEHVEDAFKLESDGKIHLFEIWLRSGGRIYLKNNNTVTWQGHSYENIAIALTGVGSYSDDKQSRPTLNIVNPKGIFAPLIRDGEANRAQVHRIMVLKQHLLADLPIFQRQTWQITRVVALIKDKAMSFELRQLTDGPNFTAPARMYLPPEFPLVSLQ
jgi:phage-related protein